MDAQPEDETLVTSGRSRESFDLLFRQHVAGVASYCRWRSRSRADAEDAVAEVFLIAWRRFDDVPAGDDARPWLYATARRVLANQARAHARRNRLNEKLVAEPVPSATEVAPDPLIGRVHDALAALDRLDRELLLLVEWEGLTPTEVATVVHRPPVAVRVRLHRARRRFRAAFEAQTAAAHAPHMPVSELVSRCEP